MVKPMLDYFRSTDFNPENPSKRQKLDLMFQETRSSSPFPSSADREAAQVRVKNLHVCFSL